MKNERGITLLSLVIAIVLMFILVAIVVNGSFYENGGLVNKVKDETIKQENMVQKEEDKMNTVLKNVEEDWGIGPNA